MSKVDPENPCLVKSQLKELFDEIKMYYVEGAIMTFCVYSLQVNLTNMQRIKFGEII